TADHIARLNGLPLTHPNRIGAGCIYILQQSIQQGHVYLPIDVCIRKVIQLLTNSEQIIVVENVSEVLEILNKDKSVIIQERKLFLPYLYNADDGFEYYI